MPAADGKPSPTTSKPPEPKKRGPRLEVGTKGGHTIELSFDSEQKAMSAYNRILAKGPRNIEIEIEAEEGTVAFFSPSYVRVLSS